MRLRFDSLVSLFITMPAFAAIVRPPLSSITAVSVTC
jgi:hypothetical protein